MKNKYTLIFILLVTHFQIFAQTKTFNSKIGFAYNVPKKASGLALSLEYRNKVKNNHFIALGVENIFTSRRGSLPKTLISQKHILRDFSNPKPYESFFIWTDESFPKIQLASTPDKYFNFNTTIKYLYQNNMKNSIYYTLGGGFCLSYHDEMEIVDWKNGNFQASGSTDLSDAWFPIFQYDSYLDAGFISHIEFQKVFKNRFSFGLGSKLYFFPKSQTTLLSFEGILGVMF
jgi:hypothetical protein